MKLRLYQEEICSVIWRHFRSNDGVLLVLPVGTGKTVIGLSIGERFSTSSITVVAPARLRSHWLSHAERLGVSIQFLSHTWLSRSTSNKRKSIVAPLLIVDESHRFRNPGTLRFRALAELSTRSRLLLMTATPIVRSTRDMLVQLSLWNSMAAESIFGSGQPDCNLLSSFQKRGEIITMSNNMLGRSERKPQKTTEYIIPTASIMPVIKRYAKLAGSDIPNQLFAPHLERSVASSPGSWKATHQRILRLHHEVRHSASVGQQISRASFYQLFGQQRGSENHHQNVLPWMYKEESQPITPLTSGQFQQLKNLGVTLQTFANHHSAATQWKTSAKNNLPQLVFSDYISTVQWLRSQYSGGIWRFVDGQKTWSSKHGLLTTSQWNPDKNCKASIVTTDVLATGIDLPWIQRVVHLELPWTYARLQQREGRATRHPSASLPERWVFHYNSPYGRKTLSHFKKRKASFLQPIPWTPAPPNKNKSVLKNKRSVFHVKHQEEQKIIAKNLQSQNLTPYTNIQTNIRSSWTAFHWLTHSS